MQDMSEENLMTELEKFCQHLGSVSQLPLVHVLKVADHSLTICDQDLERGVTRMSALQSSAQDLRAKVNAAHYIAAGHRGSRSSKRGTVDGDGKHDGWIAATANALGDVFAPPCNTQSCDQLSDDPLLMLSHKPDQLLAEVELLHCRIDNLRLSLRRMRQKWLPLGKSIPAQQIIDMGQLVKHFHNVMGWQKQLKTIAKAMDYVSSKVQDCLTQEQSRQEDKSQWQALNDSVTNSADARTAARIKTISCRRHLQVVSSLVSQTDAARHPQCWPAEVTDFATAMLKEADATLEANCKAVTEYMHALNSCADRLLRANIKPKELQSALTDVSNLRSKLVTAEASAKAARDMLGRLGGRTASPRKTQQVVDVLLNAISTMAAAINEVSQALRPQQSQLR